MNIEDANNKVQEWIYDGDFYENLDLDDLTSAEGLALPTSIGGYLGLNGLKRKHKDILRKLYPKLANKIY